MVSPERLRSLPPSQDQVFGRTAGVPVLQRARLNLRLGHPRRSDEERRSQAKARRRGEVLRGGTGFHQGVALGVYRDFDNAAG